MDYTSGLPSPEIFRKWAAISAISGALERKTWIVAFGKRLFPNTYIVLVAPPGVGKTVVTSEVEKLWHELPDHHTASSSVTKASLVDELAEAERGVTYKGNSEPESFNSLLIPSNELGVLLPSYDNEFMNVLTHLYDNEAYSERRRSKDINFHLPAPSLTLLAATTPSFLSGTLPDGAWDQGFLSRTFLVYSGERVLRNPFEALGKSTATRKDLLHDLTRIGAMSGEFMFTDEARDAYVAWYMAGGSPAPDHPKLHNYLTRRGMHLLKLCIIMSAASGTGKVIEIEHYRTALDALVEMETYIPDIFKAMKSGGDMKAVEDAWYFLAKQYAKDEKPVREAYLFRFLQERVPAHSVEHVANIMIRAGLIKETQVNKVGRCFIPGDRTLE